MSWTLIVILYCVFSYLLYGVLAALHSMLGGIAPPDMLGMLALFAPLSWPILATFCLTELCIQAADFIASFL